MKIFLNFHKNRKKIDLQSKQNHLKIAHSFLLLMGNPENNTRIQELEQLLLDGKKTIVANNKMPVLNPKMSFSDLRLLAGGDIKSHQLIDLLSTEEGIKEILSLYGLDLYPYFGIIDATRENTSHLVQLSENGIKTTNNTEIWLPKDIAEIIKTIGDEFYQKFGQYLEICSGYRGPAYQIYLICYYACRIFNKNGITIGDRDLSTVTKTAAPPGCSEHQFAKNSAFDVANFRTDIAKMSVPEIRQMTQWIWFKTTASRYGIEETYGIGKNNDGLGEPWHFRKVA